MAGAMVQLTRKHPHFRYHYGIHETGEFFYSCREICAELRLTFEQLHYHIRRIIPWNGLHLMRFLRTPRCFDCGVSLTPDNRVKGNLYQCRGCRSKSRRIEHRKEVRSGLSTLRARNLKRQYGLTEAEYAGLLDRQGGVCAICKQPETWVKCARLMPLAVDHNHETGQIRGLLCHRCNSMLGYARDNLDTLLSGVDYLKKGGY